MLVKLLVGGAAALLVHKSGIVRHKLVRHTHSPRVVPVSDMVEASNAYGPINVHIDVSKPAGSRLVLEDLPEAVVGQWHSKSANFLKSFMSIFHTKTQKRQITAVKTARLDIKRPGTVGDIIRKGRVQFHLSDSTRADQLAVSRWLGKEFTEAGMRPTHQVQWISRATLAVLYRTDDQLLLESVQSNVNNERFGGGRDKK